MGEPDAEWLAKNNVELADATHSSPPPSARAPHCSAKACGKEPEALSVTISADEFELAMGILKRLTNERYPCLHADVSVFPAITEFEPTFANRLPASFFPNYRVPDYIPQPPQLLRVLQQRLELSEVKCKFPTTPFGMRDDDEVLVDKIVKCPRFEITKYITSDPPDP
ncbi:Enhancer of polycomb-like protein 1 [Ceratobasidium sp. 414]|nr:Enhancer of polycomb-like protein 1 [Ceratobasidium sp. 414]